MIISDNSDTEEVILKRKYRVYFHQEIFIVVSPSNVVPGVLHVTSCSTRGQRILCHTYYGNLLHYKFDVLIDSVTLLYEV